MSAALHLEYGMRSVGTPISAVPLETLVWRANGDQTFHIQTYPAAGIVNATNHWGERSIAWNGDIDVETDYLAEDETGDEKRSEMKNMLIQYAYTNPEIAYTTYTMRGYIYLNDVQTYISSITEADDSEGMPGNISVTLGSYYFEVNMANFSDFDKLLFIRIRVGDGGTNSIGGLTRYRQTTESTSTTYMSPQYLQITNAVMES